MGGETDGRIGRTKRPRNFSEVGTCNISRAYHLHRFNASVLSVQTYAPSGAENVRIIIKIINGQ